MQACVPFASLKPESLKIRQRVTLVQNPGQELEDLRISVLREPTAFLSQIILSSAF